MGQVGWLVQVGQVACIALFHPGAHLELKNQTLLAEFNNLNTFSSTRIWTHNLGYKDLNP